MAGAPENKTIRSVSCVVLAGGESKRMGGKDKSGLKASGKTLLSRVLDAVSPLFDDIMISIHDGGGTTHKGARAITDAFPGRGPAVGIATALKEAKNDCVFAVACDMPLASAELARFMAGLMDGGYDCVVPVANGKIQPLFAVYRKTCLAGLTEKIKANPDGTSLAGFIKNSNGLRIRYVYAAEGEAKGIDPELLTFMDVDTPEDLEAVEKRLK